MQHKICCLEKFMAEDCNETTYCRNAGRLDICTFHKKNIWCTKELFTPLKIMIILSAFIKRKSTVVAMKHCRYIVLIHIKCIKNIKVLHIPEFSIVTPGQKLYVNTIKWCQKNELWGVQW